MLKNVHTYDQQEERQEMTAKCSFILQILYLFPQPNNYKKSNKEARGQNAASTVKYCE